MALHRLSLPFKPESAQNDVLKTALYFHPQIGSRGMPLQRAKQTKHQEPIQTHELRKLGGFAFREDLPSSFFLETKG